MRECGLIAWIVGIAGFYCLSWQIFAVVAVFVIILSFIVFIFNRKYAFLLGLLFLFFTAGFFWAAWNHHRITRWHLPKSLIKKNVNVVGRIASLPKTRQHYASFVLQVSQFENHPLNTRFLISWYGQYPKLKVSDQWRLTLRLKPPHSLHNPGVANRDTWFLLHGIRATGYVMVKQQPQLLQHDQWVYPILTLRQNILALINAALEPNESIMAALIAALTIGSRTHMMPKIWQVLQATGTSHLMAISGLHVGLIVAVLFFLLRWGWCLWPPLCLLMPAQRFASLGAIVAALSYSLLAGFSLPTQRAFIMIVVFMSSHILRRVSFFYSRWLWALAIVLAWQPLAIMTASLWLSFAAVALIIYGFIEGGSRLKKGWQWFRVQWILFLGLLPLTLWYFQKVSLILILANSIAIPWVSFLIVPLGLLAAIFGTAFHPIGIFLFQLTAMLFEPLWWLLTWFSHWSFSVFHYAIPNGVVLLTTLLAVLFWLAPAGLGRFLGLLGLLPLFFYRQPQLSRGAISMTLLDVGQGLATVVRTAHHVLIYDAGPKSIGGFDAGKDVVVPYLRHLGITHINQLMISHADIDHRGGAKAILQAFPVNLVISSKTHYFRGYKTKTCRVGQGWRWDGVTFSVLSPPRGGAYRGNNSSCVLRISNGHQTILLPGDIERKIERRLVKQMPKTLSATILVAPHHGSKSSSWLPFVNAVSPKAVLFPVGYYNRYGFPRPEVVKIYAKKQIKMYNTALQGAISVRISPQGQVRFTVAHEQRRR